VRKALDGRLRLLRLQLRKGHWSPCRLEVCAWLVQHSLFDFCFMLLRLAGVRGAG
jgi:hypothetical protein